MKNHRIIAKKRVFITRTYQETEYIRAKNALYNAKEYKEYWAQGIPYPFPEYYDKPVFKTITEKTSRIHYKIICDYCRGNGWVKRRDAKYCCESCRKLAYAERKRS